MILKATGIPEHWFKAGVTMYFTMPGPAVRFVSGSLIVLPEPGVTKPLTDPTGRQEEVQLKDAPTGVEVKGIDQVPAEQIFRVVVMFETVGTVRTSAVIAVRVMLLQLPMVVSASA